MANARAGSQDPAQFEDVIAGRIARLSPGQLDCLRLVDQHLSSKEIACELNISHHSVDQRIRGALHILGVDRRSQAARLVSQHSGAYQRLIHQPPYIEAALEAVQPESTVSLQIRHAGRAGDRRGWFPNRAETRIVSAPPADAVRNEEQPPE